MNMNISFQWKMISFPQGHMGLLWFLIILASVWLLLIPLGFVIWNKEFKDHDSEEEDDEDEDEEDEEDEEEVGVKVKICEKTRKWRDEVVWLENVNK